MSILIDDGSRAPVQGITGREGQFHTERMIRYGTRVVGGVTPQGGAGSPRSACRCSIRVEHQAVRETEADVSVAFVPARRWRRTRPAKRRRRASGSWWSSPSMSRFWIWCG